MDILREYWPFILIAIGVAIILFVILSRPRQRVQLSDDVPVRPHMARVRTEDEGRGIAAEAAAATSDVAGELIRAPVHRKLAGTDEQVDDLVQLKGVGPKLADMLRDLGFVRFDQLASLSENEVERLDSQLGAFRGRLSRDRIVEQAAYLARKDVDGYEQRFGKL
jgi:predicted flap endonuclease-1-like 5' DNA nuclease